jgi:cell division protein ZipA
MEDNFRNVLIIISVIVIGAIFIHGLWTIRKQKNPYKLKAKKEKVEPISRDFDGSGFDQDGVGQVTVKKTSSRANNDNIDQEPQFYNENSSEGPVEHSAEYTPEISEVITLDNTQLNSEQTSDWPNEEEPKAFSKEELGDDLVLTNESSVVAVKREPLYKQPVTNAKPVRVRSSITKTTVGLNVDIQPVKKEQIEINFGDASQASVRATEDQAELVVPSEPEQKKVVEENNQTTINTSTNAHVKTETTEQKITKHEDNKALEPQVIVLSVVMPANQQMFGAALLPSLLTLGLKYGEMNIFHRHQDNAGNGEVTFSLANMMKPGSFDLDSMETFATVGVSLFMMLPNHGDPFVVFEQMLNAAKQLATEFNAQVLDDKRNVMTQQTEQHYLNKIREFDRQNRLASA